MNAFPMPDFQSFQNMSQGFPNGMDFMKQFWQQGASSQANPAQSMGATPAFTQAMSQYLMPTLDVEEMDRRMNDLRTVLQFMELNTNMIRQSLNALEVQRNTLATLKGMAQSAMPSAASNSGTNPQATTPEGAAAVAQNWLNAWQTMVQNTQQTMTKAAEQAVAQTQEMAKQASKASQAPAAKKTAPKKASK